jgi:type III secretion protein R
VRAFDIGTWATLLVAVPFVILVTTSFMKFAVVLAILRRAFGGSSLPPATVATVLALVFALFVTAPVATRAAQAMEAKKGDVLAAGMEPVRAFLAKHAPARERQSFLELQRQLRAPAERAAVTEDDLTVLTAAFATAELKSAFEIGFLLFLPFLVIELLVATILTSLGMTTVAPETVSLPFKLMLFVAADGWHLLFRGLILGYS